MRKKIIKKKYFYTGGWSTSKTANINKIIAAYKKLLKLKNLNGLGLQKKIVF